MRKGIHNPEYTATIVFRLTTKMDEETKFHSYLLNKATSKYIREAIETKNIESEKIEETPELRERAKDFLAMLYKRNKRKEEKQRKKLCQH